MYDRRSDEYLCLKRRIRALGLFAAHGDLLSWPLIRQICISAGPESLEEYFQKGALLGQKGALLGQKVALYL